MYFVIANLVKQSSILVEKFYVYYPDMEILRFAQNDKVLTFVTILPIILKFFRIVPIYEGKYNHV